VWHAAPNETDLNSTRRLRCVFAGREAAKTVTGMVSATSLFAGALKGALLEPVRLAGVRITWSDLRRQGVANQRAGELGRGQPGRDPVVNNLLNY
jgi:hypothetical protein